MKITNPRFLIFCHSLGKTTTEYCEENKVEYDEIPDKVNMLEFILWISKNWQKFFKVKCSEQQQKEYNSFRDFKVFYQNQFDEFLIKEYNYENNQ